MPLPSHISPPRPASSLAEGLSIMAHVMMALVLRELKTRFGRHKGGHLWAIAEPVMYIGGFLLLAEVAGRNTSGTSDHAVHIASGVLAFILFRDIVQRSLNAVSGNRGLLMHPVVTPLDIILARAILELATNILVTVIIAGGIFMFWGSGLPSSTLGLLGVITLTWFFGVSVGIPLSAAAVVWPVTERIVAPLMRLAFFVSGIFFVPASLPSSVRDEMLWNPLLHITEAMRVAWMPVPPDIYGSPLYPLLIGWGLLPLGLAAERVARARIAAA